VEVVETNYDPGLHEVPPFSKFDECERHAFTEKERERAELAASCNSLKEFRLKVSLEIFVEVLFTGFALASATTEDWGARV
jgi:hypothetical protein